LLIFDRISKKGIMFIREKMNKISMKGEEDANFKPIYNCDSYDDYYCNAGYRQQGNQ
jgi:hypothetical protein